MADPNKPAGFESVRVSGGGIGSGGGGGAFASPVASSGSGGGGGGHAGQAPADPVLAALLRIEALLERQQHLLNRWDDVGLPAQRVTD